MKTPNRYAGNPPKPSRNFESKNILHKNPNQCADAKCRDCVIDDEHFSTIMLF